MSERLSQKQIKQDIREDEVQSFLLTAIEKVQERPSFYFGILGGILAAVLVVSGLFTWLEHRSELAQEELAEVIRVYEAPVVEADAKPDDERDPSFASAEARSERVGAALDEVTSGTAGEVADLYRAQLALDRGEIEEARKLWEDFLASEEDHALATSVRINLIRLDRQEGKAEAVAEDLQRQLDGTDKDLPEDVLLFELAKTREALGQTEEAKDLYQRILDEYPTSGYATKARQATTA